MRLLDTRPGAAAAPRRDLAERLSDWLSVRDAIDLQQAHTRIAGLEPDDPGAGDLDREAFERDLLRLRRALEQAIRSDDLAPLRATADPVPWHHRYLQHQRRMADSTGTLRNRLRQALRGASPRLAQLAELDATLEQLTGRREQQLLSGVPALLRSRHAELKARQDAQATELFPPAPEAWLDDFEREFRDVLLAELELRLQPVLGLIDACKEQETLNA